MRREVEVILVEAAKVGHPRDIRAFAGGKLHRQRFDDGLVRHFVDDDFGARVGGLEALGDFASHFALIAIGIALHAQIRSMSGQHGHGHKCRRHCSQARSTQTYILHNTVLLKTSVLNSIKLPATN